MVKKIKEYYHNRLMYEEFVGSFKKYSMVKYKLIKQYPGSPSLGFIIEPVPGQTWYEGKFNVRVAKDNVLNYPEFWEKVEEKQPLFITEDGKEVFEDSDVWWVRTTFEDEILCYNKPFEYGLYNKSWNIRSKSLKYKWFSTKEAAEKWIEENKPVYSKKQILNKIEETYKKIVIEFSFDTKLSIAAYCLYLLRRDIQDDKT